MESGNEGHSKLIWKQGLVMLACSVVGRIGKERKWEVRKSKSVGAILGSMPIEELDPYPVGSGGSSIINHQVRVL